MMDWDKLLSNQRISNKNTDSDKLDSDYKRIITSPSFRRLQDKTQVFPLNRGDFVRTRLTHSLEVAAIAKEIAYKVDGNLQKSSPDNYAIWHQNLLRISNVLECASLLHDIGNPPFGHFGETIIRQWFKNNYENLKSLLKEEHLNDFLNFEGNAQALRIVTRLHQFTGNNGMDLSVATLNTMIKYTRNSSEPSKDITQKIVDKKIGYFQAEKDIFNEITQVTGTGTNRHPLTYILEAADDIAYLTADIEDGIKKGLVSFDLLKSSIENLANEIKNIDPKKSTKVFSKILSSSNTNTFLFTIKNTLIWCAYSRFIYKYNDIMNGTLNSDLFNDSYCQELHDCLCKIAIKHIFNDKSILKIEIAGDTILNFLLDKFIYAVIDVHKDKNPLSSRLYQIISESHQEVYKIAIGNGDLDEQDKLYYAILMVTDFISGMTDSYAHELYMQLSGQEI